MMGLLPRENAYVCDKCHGIVTTVDVDEGVTPAMITCMIDPECKGIMHSSFYPKDERTVYIPPPKLEWYKPEKMTGLSEYEIAHVKKGGLLMRERTKKEPIYHKDDGNTVYKPPFPKVKAIPGDEKRKQAKDRLARRKARKERMKKHQPKFKQ